MTDISDFVGEVIHGDCLEVLQEIPNNSVDLVLTDPPYNIGQEEKVTHKNGEFITNKDFWGSEFEDDMEEKDYIGFMKSLSDMYKRILKKNGSVITFFDRGKPYLLKPFYEDFEFRNMIGFHKINPPPHYRKNNYRSGIELAIWFSGEDYKINFLSQELMINWFEGLVGDKETVHPTEKYMWMIKPLVRRHSREGDIVLDPFTGSGSIPVACEELNRDWIGIEKKKEYVDVARDRVGKVQDQSDLSDWVESNP